MEARSREHHVERTNIEEKRMGQRGEETRREEKMRNGMRREGNIMSRDRNIEEQLKRVLKNMLESWQEDMRGKD